MRFEPTKIPSCVIIEIDAHSDDRGLFARTWCAREFIDAGLPGKSVQCSLSRNKSKGTLRGLHFQMPPSREGKLVRCSRGAVFDVIVDIRSSSDTFMKHVHVELNHEDARAIFVPPGCAHGFQTLTDDCDVVYQMTDYHVPDLASGIRWDDPNLGIDWPIPDPTMHDRDANYPDVKQSWLRSLRWLQS